MLITEFKVLKQDGVTRAEAQVIWEEIDRTPFCLFVDVDSKFQNALCVNSNTVLVVCLPPAWLIEEERRMRENLKLVFYTLLK